MKRKMRKSVSLLLVLSMLFSLLCGMDISASAADSTLSGGETITAGGEYQLASDAGGLITIQTTEPVVIIGNGAQWDGDGNMTTTPNVVSFDASAQAGANLTLQDVHIEGSSSYNTVNFTGVGNTLTIKGTCVIDHNVGAASVAGIHVGAGTALTIAGDGTLYFYKQAQGSGIGGNTGELNGNITFDMTGMLFAKGTKQGALIGAGSGASSTTETPGFVKFVSGTYNLMSVSRAACIGGSAGSGGASDGTTVYLEKDANVNINVDFSGAAVGGGGYDGGNDSSGGTLYVNGGSLRCYIDKNAAGNTTGYQGQEFTQGVNDAAITAQRLNGQNETVYRLTFDTTALETPAASFSVQVDGTDFYSGGLHAYGFVNENLDKADQVSISSTPSNWYENGETNLYFYVTGQDHSLTVNGETFAATWNETDKSFAVEKAAAETPDPDASVWNGVLDFRWYDENNVQTEYHITTPAQWEALAWICSEHLGQLSDYATYTNGNVTGIVGDIPTQQNTFEGVQFYLDNDIDMGGVYANGAWSGPNYYPVGSQASNDLNNEVWYGLFFGSFDGQGHVVKNVYCERSDNGSGVGGNGSQAGGLFGRLGAADGTDYPATDITIENIAVSGYFHGYRSFGGVVGKTLHVASGHSITVKNCVNFASVLTQNGAKGVGGVVGTLWNGASVDNCVNFGTVTGGYRSANVGGVSGAAEGPTSNSYNVGMVTNTATAANVGAVALNQSTADVTNCYALEGSAPGYPSSILNGNTLVSGGWKTAEEMKSADFVTLLGADNWAFPAETDGIASVMAENGVAGYPVPAAFVTETEPQAPEQDADGNYLISNVDELLWFADAVNSGQTEICGKVTADIDASNADFVPIGSTYATRFAGTFDGGGHTITLNVNGELYLGLFGSVGVATIKNVTVDGSITGTQNIAGIAGEVNGDSTFENCINKATITSESQPVGGVIGSAGNDTTITLTNCANTGAVTGDAIVGGLVGMVGGGVKITGSYNSGTISARISDGGLVAQIGDQNMDATVSITDSYNSGAVNVSGPGILYRFGTGGLIGTTYKGFTLTNVYNAGQIGTAADNHSGALVGLVMPGLTGNLVNAYYLTDSSEAAVGQLGREDLPATLDGEAVSKTADELKADDMVTALNSNEAWNKDADATLNSGYPVLKWQGGTEVQPVHDHSFQDGFCTDCGAYDPDAETYLVKTAANLQAIADAVNGGDSLAGKTVTLANDIDLAGIDWMPIGGKTEEIPVPVSSQEELDAALAQYKLLYDNTGNSYKDGSDKNINYNPSYTYHYVSGTAFAGTFDGAGKSISNMTVNTDSGYAGLFGNVSGTVKDFTVSGSVTSTANGLDYVGGVTGLLSTGGTISGVTSQVAVTAEGVYNVGGIAGFVGARDASSKDNTKVINCMNTGAIMGYSQVGGITGENAGIISGCVNTGTIDGKKNTSKNGCGGIAGRNGNNNAAIEAGTIENCYNSGAIGNSQMKWVGGITGFNNELSVVKNCYDIGAVSGAGQYNPIVGQNEGNELKNGGVFNSYYLDTLRTNDANGVYGGNVDSLTGAKTADELKADDMVIALDENNDPAVWNKDADATLNSGYPVLKWQGGTEVVKAPEQDAEGNYLISNADELVWFSNAVNGGETTINGKVTADIDASNAAFNPIGNYSVSYKGTFDGDGHTITLNLTGSTGDVQGLFGCIQNATVKNVTVDGTITGDMGMTAGIVGLCRGGTIENCVNHAKVTISGGFGGRVGGIVGQTVLNATTTIKACVNTGEITGSSRVGGVVGEINSNSNTIITECSNTGAISGPQEIGGIVGHLAKAATITNCYNTGAVSATNANGSAGGLVGNWAGSGSPNSPVKASVTNAYNAGAVTGGTVGGVVGGTSISNATLTLTNVYYLDTSAASAFGGNAGIAGTPVAKTADELKADDMVIALDENNDPAVWNKDADATLNSGYPVLKWQGGTEVQPIPAEPVFSTTSFTDGMQLVKYEETVPDGKVPTCGGTEMVYSEAYDAWICLVPSDQTITNADFRLVDGEKQIVSNDGDVSGDGKLSIADAQMALDIANGLYPDLSKIPLEQYLRADANGDGVVDQTDAQLIQRMMRRGR